MGLGRPSASLVWLGGVLAASAVAAGNLAVLGLAFLPLGLAVAAAVGPRARVVEAHVEQIPERAVVGQTVEMVARLKVAGRGPLHLRVLLPDSYRLVEGRSVHHSWVSEAGERVLRFSAACDQRGVQSIGPVEAEAPSAWLLGGSTRNRHGSASLVRIDPVASRLRDVPASRTRARSPMAELDVSPTGILTSQFQDIRPYVRGDPHRSINWKASARRSALHQDLSLYVNDYEREGRRQVWVFLDARPDRVGTSLDNALERRIEAALALTSTHLRRGFSVGLTLYNVALDGTPYPDSSGRQSRRILELVASLPRPPGPATRLGEAVKSVRGHLHRARTVAYVVTTLQGGEDEDLRVLRTMLARRRGRPPIAVVHVDPANLLPDAQRNGLGRTLTLLQNPHLDAVRATGLRAIRFDPKSQSLATLVRRLSA